MEKDWKELSEAASHEQDSQKLLEIVEELDHALEQCEKELKQKTRISHEPPDVKTVSRFFPESMNLSALSSRLNP